jgi:hypothetical protein
MPTPVHPLLRITAALAFALTSSRAEAAPPPSATFLFADGFEAQQPGVAALVPVDPLGLSAFEDALVLGVPRRVWRFDGNAWPVEEQAGLQVPAAGEIPADRYAIELVFELTERDGGWRRIADVQDRQSDNGFYVGPYDDTLEVYEYGTVAFGRVPFTTGAFHHVVLTHDAAGTVKAYLDGRMELETTRAAEMVLGVVGSPLNLFLDNAVGGGTGEFSDGRIALLRLYAEPLSDADVAALAADPFGPTEVSIDVKPGSFPNAINLGSQGVVPVAILGSASFDATAVDPHSVTLASAPVRLRGQGTPMTSVEDVNGDGWADLVVQVSTSALQLSEGDTEAVLEAVTTGGLPIRGSDTVRTVP